MNGFHFVACSLVQYKLGLNYIETKKKKKRVKYTDMKLLLDYLESYF